MDDAESGTGARADSRSRFIVREHLVILVQFLIGNGSIACTTSGVSTPSGLAPQPLILLVCTGVFWMSGKHRHGARWAARWHAVDARRVGAFGELGKPKRIGGA